LCLFGGLRPFEVTRLSWSAINLPDKEIRLEANQTKTKRGRTVTICPTLHAWLKTYHGTPLFPSNWRKKFDAVKESAGFGTSSDEKKLVPWVPDILRHTAISHYFRSAGSYGQTAEQFGNSEAIIKAHYQGRCSTSDAKKFFALKPKAAK
jgi:integrase